MAWIPKERLSGSASPRTNRAHKINLFASRYADPWAWAVAEEQIWGHNYSCG